MKFLIFHIQRNIRRLVAILVILGIFWFVRLPDLSNAERNVLADHFHFDRLPLAELTSNIAYHALRTVHPSLERHSSWTSSVGASVALNDLDRDGLSNDVCYVDTRSNQVIIAPVPGAFKRYQPFMLEPVTSSYDYQTMAPMGCLPGDLNEDGLIDVLVYYWGRTPIAYLHKPAISRSHSNLSREDYTENEIISGDERWFTNAATLTDLDGDGHTDLVIGNYHPDGAHILEAQASGYEQMQHSMSRANNGGSSRFLLWTKATSGSQPTVQFKDYKGVLNESVAYGWTLAVGAADLDGDLLPEIYFANDFGPDRLLHNQSKPGVLNFSLLEGQRTFTSPRSKVVGQDSFKGMGVDFGDINRDGLLDIYVSNIASEYALEESHFLFASTGDTSVMSQGVAPYIDRSEELGLSRSGWSWESKFGDFDNDGTLEALQATGFVKGTTNRWPELHELAMGNDDLLRRSRFWPNFHPEDDLSGHQHNPFFVQASNGRYYDLSTELGLASTEVSRGIATADADGDGDLDFAIANQWEPSYFYENTTSPSSKFLGLHVMRSLDSLESTETKTVTHFGHPNHPVAQPAIGASATVYLPDGHQLVAQVDGGNGHSGARSPDLHFGLGQVSEDTPIRVDLRWRNQHGKVSSQTFELKPGWHTVLLGNEQGKEV